MTLIPGDADMTVQPPKVALSFLDSRVMTWTAKSRAGVPLGILRGDDRAAVEAAAAQAFPDFAPVQVSSYLDDLLALTGLALDPPVGA
jgi:hypothetical protein